MAVAEADEEFALHLSWRGGTHAVRVGSGDPTLEELGRAISAQCGAAFETIKLLVTGRKGYVAPTQAPDTRVSQAGLTTGCKALLMASRSEDVDQVRRAPADAPLIRGFDEELKRAARRRRTAATQAQAQPPRAEYTFGLYEAWQYPGLSPPPSEALKLLYRLANDPGILGIMAAHRYKVGLLREMPPEGKVGISPVCVLGLNTNAGQIIDLRLRTDDLKGFRKYDRIRETLIHELAHNEFSEHGADFKELNSRLGRECAAINARYTSGHAVLDSAAAADGADADTRASELDGISLEDDDDVMAATARMSGRTLRQLAAEAGAGQAGSAAVGSMQQQQQQQQQQQALPARLVAAAAALQRYEQQQQQQRAQRDPAATAAPAAASDETAGQQQAATPKRSGSDTPGGMDLEPEAPAPVAGWRPASGSGSGSADEALDDDVLRFEHYDRDTEAAEAAMRRLEEGGGDSRDEGTSERLVRPGFEDPGVSGGSGDATAAGGGAAQSDAQASEDMACDGDRYADGAAAASGAGAYPMDIDGVDGCGAGPASSDPAAPEALAAPAPTTAEAAATTAGAAAVTVTSTPVTAQRAAAPLPAPVRLVVTPPPELMAPSADSVSPSTPSAPMDPALGSGAEDVVRQKLRQAWAALSQLAAAPEAAPSDVVAALDTLETMLGNAAHFPGEDKYRRVRLGNGAFQRRVGRLPGGTILLRVAGFVEEMEAAGAVGGGGGGGGAGGAGREVVLRLRRNDPGLLWLVVSVVREARAQVDAQLAAAAAEASSAGTGTGASKACE